MTHPSHLDMLENMLARWRRLCARIRATAAAVRGSEGPGGDAALHAEADAHLAELAEQRAREGVSPRQAHLLARREFGGVAQAEEACRDQCRLVGFEDVLRDLRVATRHLRRSPGFVMGAALTLGLGIAATTVVFSWTSAVFSASAPIQPMDRLVGLWLHNRAQGEPKTVVAAADVDAWSERQTAFDRLVAQDDLAVNLSGAATPVRVRAAAVTSDYFSVFNAQPVVGRGFEPAEERASAPRVAVLGHRLWVDRFGGDLTVLGRVVRIDDVPTTIVGVLPRNDYSPDLLLPFRHEPAAPGYRERRLFVSARLKDGISLEQAAAGMALIGEDLERADPEHYRGWGITVRPLQEEFVGPQARLVFRFLFGTAVLVLVIGCANVANVLVTRGISRVRELAVRTALGASRARLMRQLLAEGLVVAAAGGLFGVGLSEVGLRLLRATFEAGAPYMERASLNLAALGAALAATLTATLLCSLVPAWIATRRLPAVSLREGGHATGGRATRRLRTVLVTSEVAMAVLLVLVAVLFGRGLLALRQIRPGFDADRVLTLNVSLPPVRFGADANVLSFFERALDRLRAVPGVIEVGATTRVPAAGSRFNPNRSLVIEGRTPGQADTWAANDLTITPGYLEALRVPLRAGRGLAGSDRAGASLVAVVSEALARQYFGGTSPLGARLRLGDEPTNEWRTVVGVVGDVRHDDIDAPPPPQVYVPLAQRASREMTLVMRTTADPLEQVAAARAAMADVDPDVPLYDVRTLPQILADDLRQTVVLVGLSALFGSIALLLAATGIYAVVAHGVVQATREIGIRLALGASRVQVMRAVARQGLTPVAVGLALGALAGALVARSARSLLYGVSAGDPSNYVVAVGVLAAVAVLACAQPAWRAAHTNPLRAIRSE